MLSLFSFFLAPWPGEMLALISVWTAGVVLIVYDLARMYRASKQGKRSIWYERPLLWLGGTCIVIGLVAQADRLIALLPDLWPGIVFFLGIVSIGLLALFCGLLTLARSANMQETPTRPAHKAQRTSSQPLSIRENPLLTIARMSLLAWACLCLMEIWFICGLLFHFFPSLPLLVVYMFALGFAAVGGIAWTFAQLPPLSVNYLI